jgi:hypothetical protein
MVPVQRYGRKGKAARAISPNPLSLPNGRWLRVRPVVPTNAWWALSPVGTF